MSKRIRSLVSEDFVTLALDQLEDDGLLENKAKAKDRFAGFSRREVIRKVGFASAVALPLVSSLIAPTASMAQSGCAATGAACGVGGDCCSGACAGSLCCATAAGLNLAPNTFIGCVGLGQCNNFTGDNCCSGVGVEAATGACPVPGTTGCSCG